MKNIYFIFMFFILFLSTSCSSLLLSNPFKVISEKDQTILKDAIYNKDWDSAHKLLKLVRSSSVEYREIESISNALFAYNTCKNVVTRDKREDLYICLESEMITFNAIPQKISLGQPVVIALKLFLSDLKKEIKNSRAATTRRIKTENAIIKKRNEEIREKRIIKEALHRKKKKERIAKRAIRLQKEKEHKAQIRFDREARESARKKQQEKKLQDQEVERKEALDKAARIKLRCQKEAIESKPDRDFWKKIVDGKELDFVGIARAFKLLEQKPLGSECFFPKSIEAEKIPTLYRGKPVRGTGRVIQILAEKVNLHSTGTFVTHGIIKNRRGDLTYFFAPGKTTGINKRSRVIIEGYFVQNYEYETANGMYVGAPVIVGKMRKY